MAGRRRLMKIGAAVCACMMVASIAQAGIAQRGQVDKATGEAVTAISVQPMSALNLNEGGVAGAPPNDNCEQVVPVELTLDVTETFTGNNDGATNQCAGFDGGHVWLAFTTSARADVTLDYCTTNPAFGNAWLNLSRACPCAGFTPAAEFDTTTCSDGNVTMTWAALAAGTYYYPVLSDLGSVGDYTIHVLAAALPTGACCTEGSCSDDVTEVDCDGRWSDGVSCASNPFTPACGMVACCVPQGGSFSCDDLTAADCGAAGGTSHVSGVCAGGFDCTLAVCDFAEGACDESGSGVGCADRDCCRAVCELDAFCCNVQWDQSCADFATDVGLRACAPPNVPWSDNFDSYTTGSQLHGQGGWQGWDNNAAWGANAVSTEARSVPNAVNSVADADLVHLYFGANSGQWVYTTWQFITSRHSGISYFIMLNTYADGGGATVDRWSVQLGFDAADGMLHCDCGGPDNVQTPYAVGRWAEIRLEIDLDNDWVDIFYDGNPVGGYQWTTGVFGDDVDGQLSVGAVDLFANGAFAVFYDDFSLLSAEGGCPSGTVTWVSPPNGVVDARQPHSDGSQTPAQGIDTIVVEAPAGADAGCWSLCETSDVGVPNSIDSVDESNGTYTIHLQRPITAGAVTSVTYGGVETATFTAHPANVNGDSASSPADIIDLIDYLNGVSTSPWGMYSEDVNRSGLVEPSDILTVIDLLNGAGAFDPWNATGLPDPAGCP